MLESFHVHDTPLRLLGGFHRGGLEGVGVFLQQLVGHIGDGALRLHRLLGMGKA